MSHSVWPHRWQPTRLHHLWDSLGKDTGVGCHFLHLGKNNPLWIYLSFFPPEWILSHLPILSRWARTVLTPYWPQKGFFFLPFSLSPATRISKADYAEHGMLPIKKFFVCACQHLILVVKIPSSALAPLWGHFSNLATQPPARQVTEVLWLWV